MFEVQLLIPLSDNEGDAFDESDFEEFREELLDLFGGYTEYPGTTLGGWVHDGDTYTDESRIFGVAISSLSDGPKVVEAAEFAADHFDQESVFVRYLGRTEFIG